VYVLFSLLYLALMLHMAVDIYYYGAIKTDIPKEGDVAQMRLE
jgi:hypothetical protein